MTSETLTASRDTILNWNWVFGATWQWLLVALFAGTLFLFMLISVWAPWRWIIIARHKKAALRPGKPQPQGRQDPPRPFTRSLAIAGWSFVLLCAAAIWVDTVFHSYEGGWTVVILLFGVSIIVSTFVLEGLETAYTELRDKDRQQFKNKRALATIDSIFKMKQDNFFDAREWTIIVLLVAATYLIEQKTYFFPLMGKITEELHPDGVSTVRLLLTIALTTFALVWIAQSPGKYVARKNSVAFLAYLGPAPIFILDLIWKFLCFFGLQHPSDAADQLALKFLPRCTEERDLPPSEFSFFADGLKKYGYGFLVSSDRMNIAEKGAVHCTSDVLIYVSTPQAAVKRYFAFESAFVANTKARLENPRSKDSQYWAFKAPIIGERVTDDLLATWNSLLYSPDPDNWAEDQPQYTRVHKREFEVSADVTPAAASSVSKSRPTHRLDIRLKFFKKLPDLSPAKGGKEALLILWKLKASTEAGTVLLPDHRDISEKYPFSKKYAVPCLRSTMEVNLAPGLGYRFEYPSTYKVSYEKVEHQEETERFEDQVRPSREAKFAIWKNEPSSLVFFVDSPLPAGDYEYVFAVQKEQVDLAAADGEEEDNLTSPIPIQTSSTANAKSTSAGVI